MNQRETAAVIRIMRNPGATAPRWLTPERAVALTPLAGDLLRDMEIRRVRILLLVAVARRGLHDLRRAGQTP